MNQHSPGIVIVTGAAGNLGAATARCLAAAGLRLSLWDREAARLEALGLEADCVGVDVLDEAAVAAEIDRLERLAPVVGLVSTVGGYLGGREVNASSWADVLGMLTINLRSLFCCAKAVSVGMAKRKQGSIVAVSSTAAFGAGPGQAAYSAAKSAVSSLTRSLAAELKPSGVRVNAVLPGTLDTPENRSWMGEDDIARAVAPAAVAEVIAFLLSDAARAVTGVELPVTGKQ